MTEFEETEGFEGMEDEFMDEMHDEVVSAFVKSAAKSATKLTALIIENNRHNDTKMTTDDIYQIYTDSFVVAMSAIAQVQVQ